MEHSQDIPPEEGGIPAGEETHPMTQFLEEVYNYKRLQHGDVVPGTVVRVSSGEILIDIGTKSEGILSSQDMERMDPDELAQLKVGDQVLAYVVKPEDTDGHIVLSLSQAQLEKDWRTAEELWENGETFESVVAGYNKGGLIVHLGKVRGFVPGSQLENAFRPAGDEEEVRLEKHLGAMVGQSLRLKVIEVDRSRNRLILSERAAMREWRAEQKDRLLADLREGEIRRGHISSLCDFGAFVDLGGADGLIHLSEMSWSRVNHPSELLQVGDEVEVYVLHVDRARRRIGLSLKRLQPEPWNTVNQRYAVGQLVQGTITKLAKFGAFARLDDDIEGLIHVSELSDESISHPREVVKEGDRLALRIIRIDSGRRRLGLSLRRASEEQYAYLDQGEAEDEYAGDSFELEAEMTTDEE